MVCIFSRRPNLFIETCSLQNAAPSPLARSHVIYFKRNCLGWRQIFHEWAEKLTLQVMSSACGMPVPLVSNHSPVSELLNTTRSQMCTLHLVREHTNPCCSLKSARYKKSRTWSRQMCPILLHSLRTNAVDCSTCPGCV